MLIDNMTIKTKLLLLLFIPSIMIIYLSFIILADKYAVYENTINLKYITLIDVKISDLVHELQKERGLSSGLISSKNSNKSSNNIFASMLTTQKLLTDLRYTELMQTYKEHQENSSSEKISKDIEKLYLTHNELLRIRARVLDSNISKNDLIAYYSDINRVFLDSIYKSFKYSKEPIDTKGALAYSDFLYAKENAGILRADASSIFVKDSISKKERLRISNLISSENLYLERFFKLADEETKLFYNKTFDHKREKEINKIESMLLNTSKTKDFHIGEVFWFQEMTKKIDNLKVVEDYISQQMIENISNRVALIKKQIFQFILIGLSLVFTTFFIAVMIATNINNSLNKILEAILRISDGSTELFKNITIKGKNEFTVILDTLNEMVISLNKKDKINNQQKKKLLRANKKAIQSVKAKSEFLANMSHEIRTPLNAILGFIDLLKDENKNKSFLKYIEVIDVSSKSLLKVIEDILDFSKIESGRLDIDKIDFNTRAEFEVITYLFNAKCLQKNITLSLLFDEELPQIINTDPLRIKQVISNLLSNAIKFSKEGKNITVEINYKEGFLYVWVKDEGKGIAQDKLSHIFESFSQEDSSTTREYGGTGLGLSISSKLVELLGGELKVKSEIGVGSEFYFYIPVTISQDSVKIKDDMKELTFEKNKRPEWCPTIVFSFSNK